MHCSVQFTPKPLSPLQLQADARSSAKSLLSAINNCISNCIANRTLRAQLWLKCKLNIMRFHYICKLVSTNIIHFYGCWFISFHLAIALAELYVVRHSGAYDLCLWSMWTVMGSDKSRKESVNQCTLALVYKHSSTRTSFQLQPFVRVMLQ